MDAICRSPDVEEITQLNRNPPPEGIGRTAAVQTHQGKAILSGIDDLLNPFDQFAGLIAIEGALKNRLFPTQGEVEQYMQRPTQPAWIADVVGCQLECGFFHAQSLGRAIGFDWFGKLAVIRLPSAVGRQPLPTTRDGGSAGYAGEITCRHRCFDQAAGWRKRVSALLELTVQISCVN